MLCLLATVVTSQPEEIELHYLTQLKEYDKNDRFPQC
jgi:hypothetical protein